MTLLSTAAATVAESSPFTGPVATILGSIIAAVVTGTAMYVVAKVGRRTSKEAGDWQRIEGLWDRVDELESKVETLRVENTTQATQMSEQASEMSGLRKQNDEHERKISRLEKLLAAAYRYIEAFRDDYRRRDLTPPPPPADYIDPR